MYSLNKKFIVLWLILLIWGCVSQSHFDPITFKNLTDLKPETLLLYDTFKTDKIDRSKIETTRLKLYQALEYEKGKGDANDATSKQFEIIIRMYDRHTNNRLEGGKWTPEALDDSKKNIEKAFDIAIKTERAKNP